MFGRHLLAAFAALLLCAGTAGAAPIDAYGRLPTLDKVTLSPDGGTIAYVRAGEIKHVTGIDSPYESPLHAELVLDTSARDVCGCVDEVLAFCCQSELIPAPGNSPLPGASR